MLTVVIPVYNVEAYLEKCIRSVLAQSYQAMEVLLINDGSTDRSGDICRYYEALDLRVRYIEKKNEGSGKTRNMGIKLARGEYITFLDSDDWWDKDYAGKMMQYAEEADIVLCDLCYVDYIDGTLQEHISKIRMPDRSVQKTGSDPDFINKGRTFLCGKIFRKEIFKKYDIWQPTLAINDIPIVPVLIALSETICRVGEPLYFYLRTRDGNTVSSVGALKSFGAALAGMKENFDRFGMTRHYDKAIRKMYYSQVRFAVRKAAQACKSGKITQKEYEEVKALLFQEIERFWPDWPNPEGKRFFCSGDPDINHAIAYVLFDETMLTRKGVCTYRVVEKGSMQEQSTGELQTTGRIIEIEKKAGLEEEELWWQMADELLFHL